MSLMSFVVQLHHVPNLVEYLILLKHAIWCSNSNTDTQSAIISSSNVVTIEAYPNNALISFSFNLSDAFPLI